MSLGDYEINAQTTREELITLSRKLQAAIDAQSAAQTTLPV